MNERHFGAPAQLGVRAEGDSRDNMTNCELVLNMLAESFTKDISEACNTRKEPEAKAGKPVVTSLNAKDVLQIEKK